MLTGICQQSNVDTAQPPKIEFSLPDLPQDVFLLVLSNLRLWDVVRCQKVSKSWRAAFTNEEYLQAKLKDYPATRELQSGQHLKTSGPAVIGNRINWRRLFDVVASRHFHLSNAKVRTLEHRPLARTEETGHWYAVGPWDYHESQPSGRLYYENAIQLSRLGSKPYLFRCSLWTYDDGVLVYAPDGGADPDSSLVILSLYDIETQTSTPVPFEISSKVVRNIRLSDRTLIIEWAEKDPFHDLNDMEQVNRHFATCFDVQPASGQECPWTVTYRSEWKMHFLGLPLNHRDRFFSTHNRHQYAIYFWQPNRSMYTGDEELPIESLFVWDISQPSAYQPSTDPSGKSRALFAQTCGPHVIARYPFHDLDYYGVRQHSEISLMSIRLESRTNSITVRENVCVAGQGYFDPAERLWCARTTMFPFIGHGPHLQRTWDGNLPPYRGHGSMESAEVEQSERWCLPVMDVVDEEAGVRFSLAETCFTGHSIENSLILRVKANLEREFQKKKGSGRHAGCHRQQLPPTPPLSIQSRASPDHNSEPPNTDYPSGPSHAFESTNTDMELDHDEQMTNIQDLDPETANAEHSDQLPAEADNDLLHEYDLDDEEDDSSYPAQWATFSEDITAELCVMGRIAGDERWLIGQNAKNQLVIARF